MRGNQILAFAIVSLMAIATVGGTYYFVKENIERTTNSGKEKIQKMQKEVKYGIKPHISEIMKFKNDACRYLINVEFLGYDTLDVNQLKFLIQLKNGTKILKDAYLVYKPGLCVYEDKNNSIRIKAGAECEFEVYLKGLKKIDAENITYIIPIIIDPETNKTILYGFGKSTITKKEINENKMKLTARLKLKNINITKPYIKFFKMENQGGCVILNNGSVYCWGLNSKHQLDCCGYTNQYVPKYIADLTNRKTYVVSMGGTHASAATEDGTFYSWGDNYWGQVPGASSAGLISSPLNTTAMYKKEIKDIDTAWYTTCTLTKDGDVYCWGSSSNGETGRGTADHYGVGILSSLDDDNITQISLYTSGCAVNASGAVYCWGYNKDGQLSLGNTNNRGYPTLVTYFWNNGIKIKQVATSQGVVCFLSYDGDVYCAGDYFDGLGYPASSDQVYAKKITTLDDKNVIKIARGDRTGCALTDENEVYCWGYNGHGECGDGTSGNTRTYPVKVKGLENITGKIIDIQGTLNGFCVLTNNSEVYCWGNNGYGQIGMASSTYAKKNEFFEKLLKKDEC